MQQISFQSPSIFTASTILLAKRCPVHPGSGQLFQACGLRSTNPSRRRKNKAISVMENMNNGAAIYPPRACIHPAIPSALIPLNQAFATSSRPLKNRSRMLTLGSEYDSCSAGSKAGGIDARFGCSDG